MADVQAAAGNGAAPVRRGRGRPPRPRKPPEEFTAEQLRHAMAQADEIERSRTMASLVAEQERLGMHPAAFATCRRLAKQGPTEAQAFYTALGRYLEAGGLIDRAEPRYRPAVSAVAA